MSHSQLWEARIRVCEDIGQNFPHSQLQYWWQTNKKMSVDCGSAPLFFLPMLTLFNEVAVRIRSPRMHEHDTRIALGLFQHATVYLTEIGVQDKNCSSF